MKKEKFWNICAKIMSHKELQEYKFTSWSEESKKIMFNMIWSIYHGEIEL